MIVLVCGPSGSGKTTLLTRLACCPQCKVVTIAVTRTTPRQNKEIGRLEMESDQFMRLMPTFRFQYSYEDSVFGLSLPEAHNSSNEYDLIDYPGEYPACVELNNILWRGLLVLPPDRYTLLRRLVAQGKENRADSSIVEYYECINELQNGEYQLPKWRVYISADMTALDRIVSDCLT